MKWRLVFVLVPVLLLGAVLYSSADARPAAENVTWPLSLITQPCTSLGVVGPGGGPPRIICNGVTGRQASISVPTPWLSDRSPELSLVGIPTFFNLQWDPRSIAAEDSQPLTMSYPVGDPTDKLTNVRVQLRLRPAHALGTPSESLLLAENLAVSTPDRLFLVDPTHAENQNYDFACTPGADVKWEQPSNALLSVSTDWGGYQSCEGITAGMATPKALLPTFTDGAGNAERYPGWASLSVPRFLALTPFASIRGAGTDQGSPAFQIIGTTRFQVEARVVWDEHQEKHVEVGVDCKWSYRDNHDFVDWSRWPGPIYCREKVTVTWITVCRPLEGGCAYGHADDWWVPYIPPYEIQAIRRPDGSYGLTYDFVSVQSQALLTTP
jgi:hypothetical protein